MESVLFSLSLFAFWGCVGIAVLALFPARLRLLQGILLAPTIGLAATDLLLLGVSRMGVPVKDFGLGLAVGLLLVSVLIVVWKRPLFPVRRLIPYFGIILLVYVVTGRPMFSYGFSWVSYCNDDMSNYCLSAQRFLNHGFFDKPDVNALFMGHEYSQYYWFLHVANGERAGSELMLAMACAISGLNADQMFMPLIIALLAGLVCAAAAMVAGFGRSSRAPVLAALLVAISPLTSLGALYQLLGQLGGLPMLCASFVLLCRSSFAKLGKKIWIGSIPAAIVLAALIAWYPETLPFLVVGWFFYVFLMFLTDRVKGKRIVLSSLIIGVIAVLAINKYAVTEFRFMLNQAASGASVNKFILFPYFLVPSGIPAAWGMIPIAKVIPDPYLSMVILAGFALTIWFFWKVLPSQIIRPSLAGSMMAVMVGVWLLLFFRHSDFGLFKLNLYMQPFFMGTLALALARKEGGILGGRLWGWRQMIFLGVMVLTLWAQSSYTNISTGDRPGGFVEIPYASSQKINQQFKNLIAPIPAGDSDILISDAANLVLGKFQALYTPDRTIVFPARDFFATVSGVSDNKKKANLWDKAGFLWDKPPSVAAKDQYKPQTIGDNEFYALDPEIYRDKKQTFVCTARKTDGFNNYGKDLSAKSYYVATDAPVNKLIFVHSKLGPHYYSHDQAHAAFFQLEVDPMARGELISSFGRHILFEVLNPSVRPRLVMTLTDTVIKQFDSVLPTPHVQGQTFGFVGRGEGRVFSEPLQMTEIDHIPYLAIDMGRDGRRFPNLNAHGLMLLWGADINPDPRNITAFNRDISLISEEQFNAIKAPESLKNFPSDLADKNLEYSGISEDGWISERSFFSLEPKPDARYLLVRMEVPRLDDPSFKTNLEVSIGGKPVGSQELAVGYNQIMIPIVAASFKGRQRVELSFSKYQRLPGLDGRYTPGRVSFIGFTEMTAPENLQNFPADLANKNLEYSGIQGDGWISDHSFFSLEPKPDARYLLARIMVPLLKDPSFKTTLEVSVGGKPVGSQELGIGENEIKIPIDPSSLKGRQRIALSFSKSQTLPEGDGRITGGRVSFIGFTEMRAPESLQNFPSDLANKTLEYAGIYSDGWISDHSFFYLEPKPDARYFVARLKVPKLKDLSFKTTVDISIGGKPVGSQELGFGENEIKIPIDPSFLKGRQRVDLSFSRVQQLSAADTRLSPARVRFIGFTEN